MVKTIEIPSKELPGMPPRTPLGNKALEYLELCDKMLELENIRAGVKGELIALFIKERKMSISVEGRLLTYAHIEKDQIKVKEPE